MKRVFALLLATLLVLSLCACAGEKTGVRRVLFYGKGYTIDYDDHTISDGNLTCTFSGSGNHIKLTYPDGNHIESDGSHSWGSDEHWSESLDFIAVLQQELPAQDGGWYGALLGLALILLGAFNAVFPKTAWHLEYGMWIKNAEPTDAALTVNRVVGAVLIALGAVCFLFLR